MELKEKVAYLKGLMEGMEYDVSTKEGKLMAAVVETLDAMAARVEEIDTDVDQLFDEVDAVSEDLGTWKITCLTARTATRKIMPMSMRRACTRLPAPTAAKWCA